MNDSQEDLQALVAGAQRTLAQKSARPTPVNGVVGAFIFSQHGLLVLIWLTLAALVVYFSGEIGTMLFGVNKAVAERESVLLLSSARASIEDYRKDTGELPDRVPFPAVAALVSFDKTEAGYLLTTRVDGQRTAMDDKGVISRSKE